MDGRRRLTSELLVSMACALAWAAIDTARVRTASSSARAFLVLLGSTSLLLGVAAVAVRRAGTPRDAMRSVVLGAALVSLPLALAAAVLERVTHHRALGGVTFACVAAVVVLFGVLCVARLRQIGRASGSGGRLATIAVAAAAFVSCATAAGLLLRGVGTRASASFFPDVVDAGIGIALFAVAVAAPVSRLPATRARYGVVAWVAVVSAGIATEVSTPSLCEALDGAPVASSLLCSP